MNPIEEFVIELLSRYEAKDLKYAAERDISLTALIIQYLPTISIKMIRFFAGVYRSQSDLFTPKNILKWLEEKRPDLAKVINENPEVKAWFRRQIREIKKFLWS